MKRLLVILTCAAALASAAELKVALRSRPDGRPTQIERVLPTARTAILICDMWDKHWCSGATERVAAMVPRMAEVVDTARNAGIQIVHAPSDVIDFYKTTEDTPRILTVMPEKLPDAIAIDAPPLPIDDSDGGCDTGEKTYKAWTREHAGLHIAGNDVISDKGPAVWNYLNGKGIGNLLVMGVHTNMCVLNRTFAIKQMTRWGMKCILVRDLTDAMYNPKRRPFVSHAEGTELVIEHIERYWCPSITSGELMRAIAAGK